MRRSRYKAQVLRLHALGLASGDIADRAGCTYHTVASILWRHGLSANPVRRARVVPAVWRSRDLADAAAGAHGVAWRRLVARLLWLYGEAEALRRINGYASERVAA